MRTQSSEPAVGEQVKHAIAMHRSGVQLRQNQAALIELSQHSTVAPDSSHYHLVELGGLLSQSLNPVHTSASEPKRNPLSVNGLARQTREHASMPAIETRNSEAGLCALQMVAAQIGLESLKRCRQHLLPGRPHKVRCRIVRTHQIRTGMSKHYHSTLSKYPEAASGSCHEGTWIRGLRTTLGREARPAALITCTGRLSAGLRFDAMLWAGNRTWCAGCLRAFCKHCKGCKIRLRVFDSGVCGTSPYSGFWIR